MHRLDLFPRNELIYQYRSVFSSKHGLDVLSHILYDLGTLQGIADTPEDVALKNYGSRLLKILGGGELNEETVRQFTKNLMLQALPKENNQDE